METTTLITVCAGLGAVLFFISGYAARAGRSGLISAPAMSASVEAAHAMQEQRTVLEERVSAAVVAEASAHRGIEVLRAQLTELRQSAAAAQEQLRAQELSTARATTELAAAQARVSELEGAMRQAETTKGELTAQLASRAAQFEALGQDNEALREQVKTQKETVEELEAIRSQHRELLLRARLAQQRVEELEHHAQDNADLRQRILDYEDLLVERNKLREEVQALSAKVFVGGSTTPPPVDELLLPEGELGGVLDQVLAAVVQRGFAHTAVVADGHGLLLAAAGEHAQQEPLAVFSGLIAQLGERAGYELPLGELRSAELVGVEGAGISIQFFRPAGQTTLAVTVLRRSARAPEATLARVAVAVEQVLASEDHPS